LVVPTVDDHMDGHGEQPGLSTPTLPCLDVFSVLKDSAIPNATDSAASTEPLGCAAGLLLALSARTGLGQTRGGSSLHLVLLFFSDCHQPQSVLSLECLHCSFGPRCLRTRTAPCPRNTFPQVGHACSGVAGRWQLPFGTAGVISDAFARSRQQRGLRWPGGTSHPR